MITGARSRGDSPRRSARPCSVTMISKSCSVWSIWDANGTMHEMPVGSVFDGRLAKQKFCISFMLLMLRNNEPWRSVHDGKLSVSQKIGWTTQTVQHPRAKSIGWICMGILEILWDRKIKSGSSSKTHDVNFQGSVHGNDTQPPNDFRRVCNLLTPQQEPVLIMFPVLVEVVESVGAETDRCSGGKLQLSRVEER